MKLIAKYIFVCSLPFLFAACSNGNYNSIPSNPASNPVGIPNNLSGVLTSISNGDTVGTGTPVEEAAAVFFANPGDSTPVLIGGVKANGYDLPVDSSAYYLTNILEPHLEMATSSDWNVTGANGIPSFTYSYSVPFPVYTGTLPDTVNRNSGFSMLINASNLAGADSVLINVGFDSLGHTYAGNYSANVGTITFTHSDIVNMVPEISFIQMRAYKKIVQTFNGKNFLFIKELRLTKQIWVQ